MELSWPEFIAGFATGYFGAWVLHILWRRWRDRDGI